MLTRMALHVEQYGTGRPVLALHGFGPDHRLMVGCLEPVFARRPGFRRIYPDLPGMGASPAPPGLDSSDEMLALVGQFVGEVLGDEPFLLVGESYGGYLARALTRTRPDQVLGLALICPIGTTPSVSHRTLPPRSVLRSSVQVDPAGPFAQLAVVQSADTRARFDTEIRPGLEAADQAALHRVVQRYGLSINPESGDPYVRPTLILTGRQDDVVGWQDQLPLLAHYPRATFAVLDVAGHNLQIEQPGLFDALVTEWIDRVCQEA
jgi:pimeloyl-ACP methyl ester carboxylesterase